MRIGYAGGDLRGRGIYVGSHVMQWPFTKISLMREMLRDFFIFSSGKLIPLMQATVPHSTHTKCGWLLRSCDGSRISNRHTWSPSSVRLTNSASVRSLRLRKTVALSNPMGTSLSEISACVCGLLPFRSAIRTEIRAGVLRNPAARRISRTFSISFVSFLLFMISLCHSKWLSKSTFSQGNAISVHVSMVRRTVTCQNHTQRLRTPRQAVAQDNS